MKIPLLPALENRQQWLDFCRRTPAVGYIEAPLTLVDFQTTFLQISVLEQDTLDGRAAIKYSLGSKRSIEPAWQLIKDCNWSLAFVLEGLEQMDFASNVRDNSLLKAHSDLSVRKFFSKERQVLAPTQLGNLTPLTSAPANWDGKALIELLSHQQYSQLVFRDNSAPNTARQLLLTIMADASSWLAKMQGEQLIIYRDKRPYAKLTPKLQPVTPRLKPESF